MFYVSSRRPRGSGRSASFSSLPVTGGSVGQLGGLSGGLSGILSRLGSSGMLGGGSGSGSLGGLGSPYLRSLSRVTGLSPWKLRRLYRRYQRSGIRCSFPTYLMRYGYLGGSYGGFPYGGTQGTGGQQGNGGTFFFWRSQPTYYNWETPLGSSGFSQGGSYGGSSYGVLDGLTSGGYGGSSSTLGGSSSGSRSWSSGRAGRSSQPQVGGIQIKA
uniref:Glycine rich superfamily member n=1 Tax=Rhipicephalus appendiculatus TaxID=34631 RepID=A0A131Z1P8_RHIAP